MPIPGSDRDQSPRRISKLRPSPAMVVALIALFVAMGGVSYAAARIGSAQIKNNSVRGTDIRNSTITGKDVKNKGLSGTDVKDSSLTGNDVKDDSLTGNDILESSLGKVPSAVKADTATTATTSTNATNVGPNGVSTTSIQNNAVTSAKIADNAVTGPKLTDDSVGADELKTIVAPVNTKPIAANGGTQEATAFCPAGTQLLNGGGSADSFGARMVTSHQTGNDWIVAYQNSNPGAATNIRAHAICLVQ